MKTWADIYNLDGSKRDEGPLYAIQDFTIERVLDAAGSVRLTVPLASDRTLDVVAAERRAAIYIEHPTAVQRLVGTGLIRRPVKDLNGLTMTLDGPDQLDELRQKNVLVNRVFNGTALTTALQELIELVRSTTDLCTGGTPSASTEAVSHGAALAFDNDPATYWESTALPATLTYTFAATKTVRRVTIRASTNGPVNFTIEGNDGGMTAVLTVVNEDGWNGEKRTYDFADPGFSSTAWQLNVSAAAGTVARIYEVEMMVQTDWAIDTTGVTGDLYAEFDGVSVLGALQAIVKQTGYHFRLSSSRAITFGALGDAAPLRIYQPGSIVHRAVYDNADVALTEAPQIVDDSEQTVNWVLPLGRGDDRVSLEFVQPDYIGTERTSYEDESDPYSDNGLMKDPLPSNAFGQSFQVAADCKIIAIGLFMTKVGAPTGTLSISIFSDDTALPDVGFSGPPAHYFEADISVNGGWLEVFLNSPLSISASTTYHVVVTTSRAASATDYVMWRSRAGNPYANGNTSQRKVSTGLWTGTADHDFLFRVYGVDTTDSPYLPRHMTGPDGTELWYLADDTSVASYGQIEQILSTEVGAQGAGETDLQNAAQLLYETASTYLERHVNPQAAYRLRLRKCYSTLLPGMLIPFKYVGAVFPADGSATLKYVDINDTFWVTRVIEQYTVNDFAVELELSSVPRPLANVLDIVANVSEQVNIEAVRRDYLPLVRDEVSAAPATPPSAKRKIYPKSDGWYDLDDTGVETRLATATEITDFAALCGANAGQTIPNNAWTIVNYETETLNADGCVVTGASWAYTVPAGGDGSYFVKASILFASSTAWTDGKLGRLRVNVSDSATLWYLDSKANEGSTNHTVMLRGCEDIPLVAGDTLSIEVFQNTGGNLDLTTDPGFCCVSIRRTDALSA